MKLYRGFTLALLTGALVSCALNSADRGGNLTIQFTAPKSSLNQKVERYLGSLNDEFPAPFTTPTYAPSTVSGFDCLAVNVIGPGISDSSENPNTNSSFSLDNLLNRTSYCTYRGVVRGPLTVTGTQEVNLTVPPGGVRLIQIVGLKERMVQVVSTPTPVYTYSNDCVREFNHAVAPVMDPSTNTPIEADVFEIGRAVAYDLIQDRTISVGLDYNSLTTLNERLARSLKCN